MEFVPRIFQRPEERSAGVVIRKRIVEKEAKQKCRIAKVFLLK